MWTTAAGAVGGRAAELVRTVGVPALVVGLVDTFGKVLLPQASGMLVYVLMAAVLLYKPEGLFKS